MAESLKLITSCSWQCAS